MGKLEEMLLKWPDAKEYKSRNQVHVTEEEACTSVYGKPVQAKCLFERSIPSGNGVMQVYIFSEEAARKEVEHAGN